MAFFLVVFSLDALDAQRESAVFSRLKAIAFTDSVHSVSMRESERIKSFFTSGAVVDWVQSDAPLDTPIDDSANSFNRHVDSRCLLRCLFCF